MNAPRIWRVVKIDWSNLGIDVEMDFKSFKNSPRRKSTLEIQGDFVLKSNRRKRFGCPISVHKGGITKYE